MAVMNEDRFWSLIAETHSESNGDLELQADILKQRLGELPPEQIVTFDQLWRERSVDAYRWDLWAAAYVINGGCSDDCFSYFRDYLISLGRDVYESAVRDPDSLAPVARSEEDLEWEIVSYVRAEAYERATGKQLPAHGPYDPSSPAGDEWDEDEVGGLVPRLAEKWS